MTSLFEKSLSEPYSVFTYRYFLNQWPQLGILVFDDEEENQLVGAIIGKMDIHRKNNFSVSPPESLEISRGYIGMIAILPEFKRRGIGSELVNRILDEMQKMGAHECILETEVTNMEAQHLYNKLGFVIHKRFYRYYLNGNDAFRLCKRFPVHPEYGPKMLH